VTAEQIIEEIRRLDPKDQLGVIRFAYQLDAERKLSGNELSGLAARMTETDDPAEAARIRQINWGCFQTDSIQNLKCRVTNGSNAFRN
jgi:hypothetical protein